MLTVTLLIAMYTVAVVLHIQTREVVQIIDEHMEMHKTLSAAH